METNTIRDVHIFEDGSCKVSSQKLLIEEPLVIRVENKPYAVVMRTPGKELSHAAGFCLAEGLVDNPNDFLNIDCSNNKETNTVNVTLSADRRTKVSNLLQRKGFISQTSCGICGKEFVRDLCQVLIPNKDKSRITFTKIIEWVKRIDKYQMLYKATYASHAALIVDTKFRLMAVAEDVGRHNALDKAIGEVFMNNNLENAKMAILSSRLSYELVQKAARAQLTFLIGISRPTAMAVELANAMNMTLACVRKNSILIVFCGKERIMYK